jgi:AcrR family transcriptional regulator
MPDPSTSEEEGAATVADTTPAIDSVFYRPDKAKRAAPRLSRERIVTAAVEFLDREGSERLTMRKFAEDLQVHPTSLYWYVKRREDLIDLAIDETLRAAAETTTPNKAWDVIVIQTATMMHDAFTRHPWVAAFAGARPLIGPNALIVSGRILAALASTGAEDRKLAIAGTTISNLILGSATAAGAAAALGLTDPDSALARQVVSRVSSVYPPPASSAGWTSFFNESLDLVMIGIRSLLISPGSGGD